MKLTATITLTIIGLSACATGPFSKNRDLESSARQQGQVVACSGYKTWPDCDKAAAKACPGGFEMLSKDENLPTQTRTMRINCK